MKKTILFITVILIAGTLVLAAGLGKGMNAETTQGVMNQVQGQGQGVCENFVDEDNDGVCDNYGTGIGSGSGNGSCDGSGEGTGIPLNPQDGTGHKYGGNRK